MSLFLDPSTWWLVALLSFGIFVQSAAGFAAGLLIVPAMLWSGYSIPEAQASLIIATIPQNIWGVWSFRDALQTERIVWPGLARVLALPIGVMSLQWLENFSIVTLRQFVGGFVLVATTAIIMFRPTPRSHVHPAWAWLAFPLSGFLQGIVGMGGPPMVFWVQAHDWDTRQSRVFLFTMYMVSIVPAMGVLVWFFGWRVIPTAFVATVSIPLLLGVTWLGLKVGTALGTRRLRVVTLGLLFLMGVAGLCAPLIGQAVPTETTSAETSSIP